MSSWSTILELRPRSTFEVVASRGLAKAPADVFASLGDRVARVWHFDAAKQGVEGETAWSFWDPRPQLAAVGGLDEVKSGLVVVIIITPGESIDFASTPGTLFAGSNYVSLD